MLIECLVLVNYMVLSLLETQARPLDRLLEAQVGSVSPQVHACPLLQNVWYNAEVSKAERA